MSYYRGYPTDFIFLPSIFNSGAPRKTPECMPSSDSDAESERRNHWQARQHGGTGESPPHALHERGHSQQGQPMYAIHGKPKTGQTDLRAQGRGVGGNGERDMRSISGIMDKNIGFGIRLNCFLILTRLLTRLREWFLLLWKFPITKMGQVTVSPISFN